MQVLPFGVMFLSLPITFGLQCYECYNAIDSSKCSYHRECGKNEHCAIQRLANSVGEPRYHLTCMNDDICNHGGLLNIQPIGRRKRSSRELQCCDTDFCNHELLPGSDVFTTAISSIDCTDSELCVELSNTIDVCSHGDTAIKLCPRLCDRCDAKLVVMTTEDHCVDTNVNCFYLNKSLNLCNKTEEAVMVGCRETCDLCREGQQATTTTLATSTSTSTTIRMTSPLTSSPASISKTTAKPTATSTTKSTTMLKKIITSSTSQIKYPATITTSKAAITNTKQTATANTAATATPPQTATSRGTATSPKIATTPATATSPYATAKPTTILQPTATTPITGTTPARTTTPITSTTRITSMTPVTTKTPGTTTTSTLALHVTATKAIRINTTITAVVMKIRSQSSPSSTAPSTIGTTTPPCQKMFCLLPCGNHPRYKTDKYGCPRCECAY